MPTYAFRRESDGAVVEQVYRMAEAPKIGDRVTIDGHECVRLPSDAIINGEGHQGSWGFPFRAHSLPKNMPGAKCDKNGTVIVRNLKEARSLASQGGYSWNES